ncbi:hypothetical protein A2647_03010 [Candidatus Nomurabacteria bacterium RIFCSPHIGHO2_01_FULL_40_24b]|uniref:Uncharacterized protein n=1 Tax=Candidatus Nomurabacteria bacterium RIFCSPHIGHO2_01_FULL_40_24b TaxID=1801739 RepID=A0A1F6V5Z8_9BACT|nr:MAG: hypothetical protein A2647_03010 [Candidatus Nomurabacteria bacterium RIFCSPHIGHO2_01_FULL_40_24b]
MSKLTSEEKEKWHNRGEKDGAEGRSKFYQGPWCGPFESAERFKERLEAYEKGHDNGTKQKK